METPNTESPEVGEGRIDPRAAIQIHMIVSGEHTQGWVHTHGMEEHELPELEIRREHPLFLMVDAAQLLNEVADYLLNDAQMPLLPGQNIQFGKMALHVRENAALPGEEGHFESRFGRLELVAAGMACACCGDGA